MSSNEIVIGRGGITRRQNAVMAYELFLTAKHLEVMEALRPHYNDNYVDTLICSEILLEWFEIVSSNTAGSFDELWWAFYYTRIAMTDPKLGNLLSVRASDYCNFTAKASEIMRFIANLDNRISQYC
jgi:hypothetical protein